MRQDLSLLLVLHNVCSMYGPLSESCIFPHTTDSLLNRKMHVAKLTKAFTDGSVNYSLAGQQSSNSNANVKV